jgi:hypothetical protein
MKPLIEYYYFAKALLSWKICEWVAWYHDPKAWKDRLKRLREDCGGQKQSQRTVTWEMMIQAGRGETVVTRALPGYLKRFPIGSQAADGVVHRFGTLEEVNLMSLTRPDRLTVFNFGSYT